MLITRVRQGGRGGGFYIDRWLLGATFALLIMGLLMLTSSSMVISDVHFGQPFHFLLRQASYVVLGGIAAVFTLHISIARWERWSVPLLMLGLFLLVLVLIPGIGRQVNGSQRWLHVGSINFQVSEPIKLGVVLYVAGYLVRHIARVRQHIMGSVRLLSLLAVVSVLLLLEPDFGSVSVIMLVALGMLFLAGTRLLHCGILLVTMLSGFCVLVISAPYRLERLTAFWDPWASQFSTGYQLTQSLIAFGRGGTWGVGLGNSMQKLFYLPEAHTDFLFAILAEELGMVGQLIIFALFSIIVFRALSIGRVMEQSDRLFEAYTAYGIGLWLGLQAMINIGVNMGILPTKGLTLPLVSYGGNSLVIVFVAIAILLRIYHEACQDHLIQ